MSRAVEAVCDVVGTVAALFVSYGSGKRRQTRAMAPRDRDAIVDGLTGIITRHSPAGLLSPDLVDLMGIATAVGRHIKDGPLTIDLAASRPTVPTPDYDTEYENGDQL